VDFSPRLLDFPVRTAAVASLLADLKAKGIGDIAALQAVIGDSALWDDLLGYWLDRSWIRPAPHSPAHVFSGEQLEPDLSLQEFCGLGYDSRSPENVFTEEK